MLSFLPDFDLWIWIGISAICCFIESFTFCFIAIWAALAAIPLIFIAKTPLPFLPQVFIFLILTAVWIIFIRPLVVKKLKIGKNKTNADNLAKTDSAITKPARNLKRKKKNKI